MGPCGHTRRICNTPRVPVLRTGAVHLLDFSSKNLKRFYEMGANPFLTHASNLKICITALFQAVDKCGAPIKTKKDLFVKRYFGKRNTHPNHFDSGGVFLGVVM
jgi:hypothetical protein